MKGRPDCLASEVSKASEVIWASKVKKDCPDRPGLVVKTDFLDHLVLLDKKVIEASMDWMDCLVGPV